MQQLSDGELSLILSRLDGQSYRAAKFVNRQWSRVSRSLEIRKQRFLREWGMKGIEGIPKGGDFLEMASPRDFVKRHMIEKGDSLAKLAVKYSCTLVDLKVTNNLISDNAFMSRKELLIRVDSKAGVKGQLGQIYYSREAKREFILVFPADHVFEESVERGLNSSRQWLMDSTSPKAELVRNQLVLMLSRKFKIQELVAESYLAIADWDVLQAIEQYKQDEVWQEQKHV